MQRILVVAPAEDQRGRAVWLASALARRTGASLHLVRVLEENGAWLGDRNERVEHDLRSLILEAESQELARVAETVRSRVKEPIQIETEVRWGVPWEILLELVEARGFDLVVTPARGLSHAGRVFFGTTALQLFRRCPCPVWVVGDDGHLPQRILVAIDPSSDATRRDVASKLLAWAESARTAADAELEILSAWDVPAGDLLKTHLEPAEFESYVLDLHQRAESGLQTILDANRESVCIQRVHLVRGSARDIVPTIADDREVDLVVVGTLGRSGVAGELLGETAEMILRSINCSMLVVGPRHGRPDSARAQKR